MSTGLKQRRERPEPLGALPNQSRAALASNRYTVKSRGVSAIEIVAVLLGIAEGYPIA